MKRKVIALLLVAIMILTAFGAVAATTQKVAAASVDKEPKQPNPISIPYKPGATYTFTADQFTKYDSTYYWFDGEGGAPFHAESAVGGVGSSSTSALAGQKYVQSLSFVGIAASIAGIPNNKQFIKAWEEGKLITEPCKVTMHFSYNLAANGETMAKVLVKGTANGFGEWEIPAYGDPAYGNPSETGTITATFNGNIATFFGITPARFGIYTVTGSFPNDPNFAPLGQAGGSASATVVLDYITIEFPAS